MTIAGLTIHGLEGVNYDAVDCEQGSTCTLIEDTIEGEGNCVGVYILSRALIYGGILQNCTGAGAFVRGDALIRGTRVQNNPVGIVVLRSGRANANTPDAIPVSSLNGLQPVITGNNTGVQVFEGGEFQCAGCIVQQNSGDGLDVDVSSAAVFTPGSHSDGSPAPAAVTNNGGFGVSVGDLSSASFHGQARGMSKVFGNGSLDILCAAPTSVTRNALAATGGAAHTNCTN